MAEVEAVAAESQAEVKNDLSASLRRSSLSQGVTMKASNNIIELIKKFEGLSLKPYLCPANIPTIGYGSTIYPSGAHVTMKDAPITEERAKEILLATLKSYENAVNRYVKRTINQNQFDALVDFAYNVGIGALQSSTLLKKINAGDLKGASLEFAKWVHGGGKILPGLVKRREAERLLFTKDMA